MHKTTSIFFEKKNQIFHLLLLLPKINSVVSTCTETETTKLLRGAKLLLSATLSIVLEMMKLPPSGGLIIDTFVHVECYVSYTFAILF